MAGTEAADPTGQGAAKPLVGFVGLGMMGTPMAHRLHAAGYPLLVHDALPEPTERFVAAHPGARTVQSPDDFAAAAVIVTMLPNSDIVDDTLLGADRSSGLAAQAGAGTVFIDMGSSQPLRSRALAALLAEKGLRFLDAPVSGGVRRAVDGSLAIMVGGDADLFEAQRPLFAHLGKTILHVGPAGAGHAVKALNNYVSAAGLVAAAEALHAGQAFGLDPAVMTDVFNHSTGRNNTTELKVKPYMLSGRFDSGFSLQLMLKDLGIAMGLAEQVGSDMPVGRHVLDLWRAAGSALPATADHTEMYRHLQKPQN